MNRLYILLTVMVVMVGAALFMTAHDSAAQGLTGCQNPQQVLGPVTLNGDSTTNSFTTTTSGFRVNYDGAGSEPAPNSTAEISIRGVAGFSETVDANADTSVFFNLPPGTYRVDVNLNPGPEVDPESKSYIVSVDQCRETTPTPTGDIATCQNAQEVLTVGPTNGNTNETFTTTGNFFRVNYDVNFDVDTEESNAARIRIEDSSGGEVASRTITEDENNSFIVNAPAGTYRLVVNITPTNGANYTVTVDDCLGTTTGTTDVTGGGGAADATGGGGAADNTVIVGTTPGTIGTTPTTDGTTRTVIPGGSTTVIPGGSIEVSSPAPSDKKLIVPGTTPRVSTLPETGGLSFPGPAIAVLALLISGSVIKLLSVVRR